MQWECFHIDMCVVLKRYEDRENFLKLTCTVVFCMICRRLCAESGVIHRLYLKKISLNRNERMARKKESGRNVNSSRRILHNEFEAVTVLT